MGSPVINLSSRTITEDELTLLSKGLSFCPMGAFNDFEVEMYKFERSLKLRQFFSPQQPSNPKLTSRDTQFKLKSDFIPSGQFPTIETFIKTVKYDVRTNNTNNRRRLNLNSKEREALKTLRGDNSIITKHADKGGAIVVMDYDEYRKGMLSMLSDVESYTVTTHSNMRSACTRIKQTIDLGRTSGWVTDKMADFLYDDTAQIPL